MKNKLLIIFSVIMLLWIISYAVSSILISKNDSEDKIVIIPIKGMITLEGSTSIPFQESAVSSTKILELLEQAKQDSSVKGVILEINSPGGTVVATEEIANSVKSLGKPVTAWIRETGASGAYWIATAADKIVADPLSVTGSIGVIGSYLEFSGLFEKYGVSYERLVSGEFKDTGSPYKKISDKEQLLLQKKLDLIHEHFIREVSKNRKLPLETTRELSNGAFYLGEEALESGLIDYLGSKELAVNITKKAANIKDAKVVKYQEKKTIFDFFSKISLNFAYSVGKGLGSELFTAKNDIKITI